MFNIIESIQNYFICELLTTGWPPAAKWRPFWVVSCSVAGSIICAAPVTCRQPYCLMVVFTRFPSNNSMIGVVSAPIKSCSKYIGFGWMTAKFIACADTCRCSDLDSNRVGSHRGTCSHYLRRPAYPTVGDLVVDWIQCLNCQKKLNEVLIFLPFIFICKKYCVSHTTRLIAELLCISY